MYQNERSSKEGKQAWVTPTLVDLDVSLTTGGTLPAISEDIVVPTIGGGFATGVVS